MALDKREGSTYIEFINDGDKQMNAFTTIIVKKPVAFRLNGSRGKPVIAKLGDRFVTTSYVRNGQVTISRERGALLGVGYRFSLETVNEYFEAAE